MSDQPQQAWNASRSAAGSRNPWLVAVVVSIATFMVVLDSAIANVALRYIAGSVGASLDQSTWIITTYLIANVIVTPMSGWLSNVVGRKRFYLLCVAVFTVSSLLCGLATSLGALIAFRILQGLGGGGMPASEQAILADTFPPEQHGRAFAVYGVAVLVAPTIGPTLGGWLTDTFSWHWIFFINVPIGIASLALVQWLVVEPEALEQERRTRLAGGLNIDLVGFTLLALALGCLETVLDRGQDEDWFNSPLIVGFAIVSAVSFVIFVPWELTRRDPIVDLRLLRRRQFGMSFLVMLATGAILYGTNQIMPQLLQTAFPYTAELSGIAMMPGGLAMLAMLPFAGRGTTVIQPKYLIAFGLGAIALAMWYATSLPPDASFGYFAVLRAYQMAPLPFVFIPVMTIAYEGIPPAKTNESSALVNVARNLGGSIGVSLANNQLFQRSQFHQSRLVEHFAPASHPYQSGLREVIEHFAALGSSTLQAQQQAIGYFGQLVARQATLLGYVDVFYSWALFAALLVPLVLVVVRRIELPARIHLHIQRLHFHIRH
jgi:MFS transporter, DHA2 family, multidrug resistance protein